MTLSTVLGEDVILNIVSPKSQTEDTSKMTLLDTALFKYVKLGSGIDAVWAVFAIICGVINGGFMYQGYMGSVEVLGKVRIMPDDYESPAEMTEIIYTDE